MPMTREDVLALLGPVDEVQIAEVVATGATADELAEALGWINAEDALVAERKPPPSGRVARLVELLAPAEEPEP
ncbi:hypothetical protein [Hansschlegelia zhihuaiae]|uniref:hypothetical protein n=1 Tax=Hansschlegelia zhihuaiae TaxID=405005 RepID=UPI0013E8F267|nr:hypothetical protein [Hansschlegelia zhihuaiae]